MGQWTADFASTRASERGCQMFLCVSNSSWYFVQGVDVYLKSDGSGAGRGGGEQKDVLPPLMPGLPGRRQE